MVPQQHSGPDNFIEIPMQKDVICERVMKDHGVIPDTGFPQVDDVAKEEERAMSNAYGKTRCSSHTSYI